MCIDLHTAMSGLVAKVVLVAAFELNAGLALKADG